MIDVNGHISSVERRVGSRTLAAGEARARSGSAGTGACSA